jgi:CBS domain-containing protein
MQQGVVTVGPETALKEVASLLARHRISGLPVCEADGRVVGVISEGDVIVKEVGVAGGGAPRGIDRRRLQAMTVADAMTAPAVTIESTAPVSAAAELMTTRHVNRLPVVDGDRLVGIVTRADLVRAFARSDREIESEIRNDVLFAMLCIAPWSLALTVHDGVVTLRGRVETKSLAELVASYVGRVPGVVAVQSELGWASEEPAGHEDSFGLGFLRNV